MKTRLLGAFVLIALLVLFVPMFFPSSPPTTAGDQTVSLAIPPSPDRDLQTKTMSLNPDAPATPASAGAVVIPAAHTGSSDGLATVDIRSHRPVDVETGGASADIAPVADQTKPDESKPDDSKPDATAAPAAAPTPPKPAASEPVIKSQAPASAPPPSSAPATPPATAARGNYSLNLSAYASSAGARSLMQRVQALGYPVSSHVIQQGGKALTAVAAGPFSSRTAAESARLKITQSIAGVPVRLESHASTPRGDEPATSAPAGKASSARAGGWAVQVAAMSSQADANALRDKLRANGFDGFVDSVTAGGKKLWRVRAGPQTQRDDALRVRDQIKSKLGLAGNVVSVP